MQMAVQQRTMEKLALYRQLFTGLTHVYGTYNPTTGRACVIKKPVTDQVLLAHLKGEHSYGVFLLVHERTRAIAVDFDDQNAEPVREFVHQAAHYGLPAYVERSKSKGYHVWMFFEKRVLAAKARLITRHILQEIEHPDIEIFPKQDALNTSIQYGNFINAPLFGSLVPEGRTVFVDPKKSFRPYSDQWQFLGSIQRVAEAHLDKIIELNDLSPKPNECISMTASGNTTPKARFGLPPCAQQILSNGISSNQRVICFRMAIHLKNLGFPIEMTIALLRMWAQQNKPTNGRRIITKAEIVSQAHSAYKKDYRGYGCEDAAIQPFCTDTCPIYLKSHQTTQHR